MSTIYETATITSKGQITLPKSIRQALGVDVGSKIAFDYTGGRVVVTRIENDLHEDDAIRGFLSLIEKDIHSGNNITDLPLDLVNKMMTEINGPVNLDDPINGDVEL
jgi:antitoxin PrlF